jgi:hypothetical protein
MSGRFRSLIQKKNTGLITLLAAAFCFYLSGCGCNGENSEKPPVKKIEKDSLPKVDVHIKRYEKALFTIPTSNLEAGLKNIQKDYVLFLNDDLSDPENLKQMKYYLEDAAIKEHYNTAIKKYPDLSWLEKELSQAFSIYSYWFPGKRIPEVYTYISGGDFAAPVKCSDSAMIIALDIYLGPKYSFYGSCGVPYYKAKYMDQPYISRDCMEELGLGVCSTEKKDGNFLDQMIAMGKLMYFIDVTLPDVPDSIKIKYNTKNLDWCKSNEGNIWAFFIDNKILYSKSRGDFMKFFSDGPFTTSFGKESPPRIAVWVGWQIVRSYIRENKGSDIRSLLKETDSQKILQLSKYKPRK